MENLTQPTLLLKPFAENGQRNSIPENATGTNQASLDEGFPPITAQNPRDGGVPPVRLDFNGLGHLTTTYDYFYQAGGTFTFNQTICDAIGGYPLGARLWYTDENGMSMILESKVANNTNNFLTDSSVIGDNGSGKPWEVMNFRGIFVRQPLLTYQWADHILNDIQWLRSNTFSWQDGGVYNSVYSHLVADFTGTTAASETVGSYTITYYLADDGHKIVLPDMESTVQSIYNESGVAWYYILDTDNQRFKLPRSNHGEIVEKYQNGTEWYRVYSDGWCEQGGTYYQATNGEVTIPLHKEMKDTNYYVNRILLGSTSSSTEGTASWISGIVGLRERRVDSFRAYYSNQYGLTTYIWEVKGYIANAPKNDQYKYLYFYVGNYRQSALEQTAGLNAGLFNGKADVDLSNTTVPHIVDTYRNGTSWYRVWSDGWCEQGGVTQCTSSTSQTITFLKEMEDSSYSFISVVDISSSTNSYNEDAFAGARTPTSIVVWTKNGEGSASGTSKSFHWRVSGYCSQI